MSHDLRAIASDFDLADQFIDAVPFGSGHINDTYLATYASKHHSRRFVLQRINHHVFPHPEHLMENIIRVTDHQRMELQSRDVQDWQRRVLSFLPTKDGKFFSVDAKGNFWRMSPYQERTRAYDRIATPELAWQAARAFGTFQELASTLPAPRLHETIPHFHDTRRRFRALMNAAEADEFHRRAEVAHELDFARERENDCSVIVKLLEENLIPERVTHNDTKINNVLLDEDTGEGLCVIDLDTTMPGSALYDFGDMVRTIVPLLDESATSVEDMDINLELYQSLIRGYVSSAHFLTSTEINYLAFAGKLITLECGMRFLTDYLQGDHYFKCSSPKQNLYRCRNQFRLVKALENHMRAVEDLVQIHCAKI